MSNYLGKANNPNTGNLEDCEFLDDFYGKHQYAVRFKDGTTYPESEVKALPMNEHKPEPLEDIEKAYPEAYRLARRFHELYEEYAPQFGYKTREDTRAFDPTSPNGRTMARVAYEVVQEENTANAERIRGLKKPRCRCMCQASNIAAIHNEALEAAASLTEK